jgi:hypothetical protein
MPINEQRIFVLIFISVFRQNPHSNGVTIPMLGPLPLTGIGSATATVVPSPQNHRKPGATVTFDSLRFTSLLPLSSAKP